MDIRLLTCQLVLENVIAKLDETIFNVNVWGVGLLASLITLWFCLTLFQNSHLIWLINQDQWSSWSNRVIESGSSGASFRNFAATVIFSFVRMILLDFRHTLKIVELDGWELARWVHDVDPWKIGSDLLFLLIGHGFINIGLLVSIIQLILAKARVRLCWINIGVT
jgi:hypothetical protein